MERSAQVPAACDRGVLTGRAPATILTPPQRDMRRLTNTIPTPPAHRLTKALRLRNDPGKIAFDSAINGQGVGSRMKRLKALINRGPDWTEIAEARFVMDWELVWGEGGRTGHSGLLLMWVGVSNYHHHWLIQTYISTHNFRVSSRA